jgi:IS30 family transposase
MPRGADLRGAGQTWINAVAALMNNRPRKPWDGKHPREVEDIAAFTSGAEVAA